LREIAETLVAEAEKRAEPTMRVVAHLSTVRKGLVAGDRALIQRGMDCLQAGIDRDNLRCVIAKADLESDMGNMDSAFATLDAPPNPRPVAVGAGLESWDTA